MTAGNQAEGAPAPGARAKRSEFDVGVAHPARVYDYWLGGKDNFAADREAAESVIAARPTIVRDVRANRAFMRRAVAYLAAEAGMRQFLDIGTGIPTANNTHEVAQSVSPGSRIVYVDHDPIVLAYARALMASDDEGLIDYLDADLRHTQSILEQAARTLDFSRPVAIMLIAILHAIGDDDDPYGIVATLLDAVPSGSYLVLSHGASDIDAEQMAEVARRINRASHQQFTPRGRGEVTRFFDGLELLEPGVVRVEAWRPVPGVEALDRSAMWGGVAVKR
jgi:hypothetical protein